MRAEFENDMKRWLKEGILVARRDRKKKKNENQCIAFDGNCSASKRIRSEQCWISEN